MTTPSRSRGASDEPGTEEQGTDEQGAGLFFATTGFVLWGLAPIFWKWLDGVPPFELLAHRVLWCGLILVALLWWRGDRGLLAVLSDRKTRWTLVASTALIGVNWFFFIWAVTTGRILQASLGYFINPLVSVLLGVLFLQEALSQRQRWAVATATIGVGIMTWQLGELPWVSLVLAITFALYGLVRKIVAATPEQGLALESWILSPIALLYLASRHQAGEAAFTHSGLTIDVLLVLTGVVTAGPLLLFTHGARRLPLSAIGLLQYLAPTLQFLLAVLVYREPFDNVQLIAFVFIWLALAIFTYDLRASRAR